MSDKIASIRSDVEVLLENTVQEISEANPNAWRDALEMVAEAYREVLSIIDKQAPNITMHLAPEALALLRKEGRMTHGAIALELGKDLQGFSKAYLAELMAYLVGFHGVKRSWTDDSKLIYEAPEATES